MADIRNYFTHGLAKTVYSLALKNNMKHGQWSRDFLKDNAAPVVAQFLLELKKEGRFEPIPNGAGYSNYMVDAWKAFIAADLADPDVLNKALQVALATDLACALMVRLSFSVEDDFDTQYTEVTEAFNNCDFPFSSPSGCRCDNTGLYLILETQNWEPTLGYLDMAIRDVLPVPPAPAPSLQEVQIELRTGRLLVADWFRIDAFTTTVKNNLSLSSRVARESRVKKIYDQFGYVTIPVGNTCPALVQNDSHVLGCYFDEDEDTLPADYQYAGSVCTDLAAATFIEYEHLVDIVAGAEPHGQQLVDNYIDKHRGAYGITEFHLKPGTYYVYHAGNHEDFPSLLKAAGVPEFDGFDSLKFVISRDRLVR